ncbi:MAG: ribosome hibernation-promoting factor, HPF/YfiA family [Henriciella sp.]
MTIEIAGRHMDVGETLTSRVADGLNTAIEKYFDRGFNGNVTIEKLGHEIIVDCSVHLPSGITLQSTGRAGEPYAALQIALDKIEKRVRRYHRRLKNHHKQTPMPSEAVTDFVIRSDEDTEPSEAADSDDAPLIIAETAAQMKTMSVSEAVMQMELSEMPAVLFRNAKHKGLNMVYRRADGHIGWVDPETPSKTS